MKRNFPSRSHVMDQVTAMNSARDVLAQEAKENFAKVEHEMGQMRGEITSATGEMNGAISTIGSKVQVCQDEVKSLTADFAGVRESATDSAKKVTKLQAEKVNVVEFQERIREM